jgi:hypothetical protein
MGRHCATKELPLAVPQDDQAIEQLEADRGHDKQIYNGNSIRMVTQKGRPTLTRSSGAIDHVRGNGRFGDLDAELRRLLLPQAYRFVEVR